MLRPEDPWFVDDTVDDPAELLKVLPEMRQYLEPPPVVEELGLRTLLEHPDYFAHAWWRDQASRSGRKRSPSTRPRAA